MQDFILKKSCLLLVQKPHLCSGQLSHPFDYYINIVIQNIQHNNYRSQQKVKILEYLTLRLLNLNLSLKKPQIFAFPQGAEGLCQVLYKLL